MSVTSLHFVTRSEICLDIPKIKGYHFVGNLDWVGIAGISWEAHELGLSNEVAIRGNMIAVYSFGVDIKFKPPKTL